MWIKAKWIVENSCTWMRYWCTVVVEAQVLFMRVMMMLVGMRRIICNLHEDLYLYLYLYAFFSLYGQESKIRLTMCCSERSSNMTPLCCQKLEVGRGEFQFDVTTNKVLRLH